MPTLVAINRATGDHPYRVTQVASPTKADSIIVEPFLNTGGVLVQLRLAREFIAAIDRRRHVQPDSPPRTEAMRRLTRLSLGGELLSPDKAAKRKRR
jgi:hypothetical protein